MTILPPEEQKKSEERRGIIEPLLLFAVLFLPSYIGGSRSQTPIDFGDPVFLLRYAAIALPQIAFLFYIISGKEKDHRRALHQYGITTPALQDLWKGFLLFLAILSLSLLSSSVIEHTESQAQKPFSELWKIGSGALLPAALASSVLTALREELFFRSYLLVEFERISGKIGFPEILSAALLFSLGHAYQGIGGLFTTGILALILGFRFSRQRRVWETVVAHSLYNSAVMLALFLSS